MMVGRPIDSLFPKAEAVIGETVLEVKKLNHGRYVRDISFTLRRGGNSRHRRTCGLWPHRAGAADAFGMTPVAPAKSSRKAGRCGLLAAPGARTRHRLCAGGDRDSQGLVEADGDPQERLHGDDRKSVVRHLHQGRRRGRARALEA